MEATRQYTCYRIRVGRQSVEASSIRSPRRRRKCLEKRQKAASSNPARKHLGNALRVIELSVLKTRVPYGSGLPPGHLECSISLDFAASGGVEKLCKELPPGEGILACHLDRDYMKCFPESAESSATRYIPACLGLLVFTCRGCRGPTWTDSLRFSSREGHSTT